MFITENTMWNRLCFESDMFLYFEQIGQIKVLLSFSQFFVTLTDFLKIFGISALHQLLIVFCKFEIKNLVNLWEGVEKFFEGGVAKK